MAGSGLANFSKSFLLPMIISAVLYLLIFHALLPLYRRHRARYSQYLPLQTTASLSSHLPSSLQPSSLRSRLSDFLLKVLLPSTWAFRERFRRRESVVSADDALFDEESGEAMVGFDVNDRDRRRDGMERQVLRAIRDSNARRDVAAVDVDDSDRRLSRELEEGFRDDSEDDDEETAVTAGRRSFSASR